jgi:probable rRNA maturation factor
MSELHLRHSQVAGTTDVLTFDLRRDSANAIEAEIVVCADEAARRGVELGHAIERELLLYCVHGLLHCAGYDDHDEAGWQRMHAREDEILRAVGVGATFMPKRGGDVQ